MIPEPYSGRCDTREPGKQSYQERKRRSKKKPTTAPGLWKGEPARVVKSGVLGDESCESKRREERDKRRRIRGRSYKIFSSESHRSASVCMCMYREGGKEP